MTRIFTCGLEEGGSVVLNFPVSANCNIASGSNARTGDYYLSMSANGTARTASISTGNAVYVGFALNPFSTLAAGYVLETLDSGGTVLGAIRGLAGGKLAASRGTTVLASGTSIIASTIYSYIECYILVHNTTGRVVVKVDGNTEIDFTGDTDPGTNSLIDSIVLVGNGICYYDDIVVNSATGTYNNSYPGIVRLYPSFPNAAGDVTQLTRGGTDTGANWDQVNAVPTSFNSYVYSTGTNTYDLYNFQNLSLPVGSQILNVVNNVVALLDSGAGSIASMVKSGATESQGDDKSLTISQKIYQEALPINPDTSVAWTPTDINNIQAGVKTR